jgi:hypothetical protein
MACEAWQQEPYGVVAIQLFRSLVNLTVDGPFAGIEGLSVCAEATTATSHSIIPLHAAVSNRVARYPYDRWLGTGANRRHPTIAREIEHTSSPALPRVGPRSACWSHRSPSLSPPRSPYLPTSSQINTRANFHNKYA